MTTIKEWCEKSGVSTDAVRVQFAKLGLSNFAKNRALSNEEISRLEGHHFRVSRKNKSEVSRSKHVIFRETDSEVFPEVSRSEPVVFREAAQAKARGLSRISILRFLYDALAICIVVGHGFLLWQEAASLYGYLGQIGGVLVFMVVCLALLYASDSRLTRTSEAALYFMGLVDLAAMRVHYETLARPDVPYPITVGFCIFIASCSWVALYMYRDSKLD